MPYDPNIPVAGSVRVDLTGRIFGQTTMNIFSFDYTGSAADVSHAQFVALFEAMFSPLVSLLSQDWSGVNYRVYSYDVGGVMQNWTDHVCTLVGAVADDAVPPNVAVVIKKRTGAPGRSQRGRWYFAGLCRADHVEGEIAVAQRAAWVTAVEDWDDQLGADTITFQPTIATYATSGNLATTFNINIVEPSYVLRNQRRRQIGVGI